MTRDEVKEGLWRCTTGDSYGCPCDDSSCSTVRILKDALAEIIEMEGETVELRAENERLKLKIVWLERSMREEDAKLNETIKKQERVIELLRATIRHESLSADGQHDW